MSVQFGTWNFDGKPLHRTHVEKIETVLEPYGPDDGGSYREDHIAILFRALHTTKESHQIRQPAITERGAVLAWDGRLDNRKQMIRSLQSEVKVLAHNAPDASIVAAAYDAWGTACFAKFIGDWALSIWDPSTHTLLLAKDPIGTRPLYFAVDQERVTWSTLLDALVLYASKSLVLSEEYIAGWFSFFPSTHLTPYVGLHSLPPSSYVLIRAGSYAVEKYWDFDAGKRIRYRADREYEEHFRTVFLEAVRRRLRSDCPVLAELSGGMDSSSIVCVANSLIGCGLAETPRLDTVSYYDDSEPNWNERPYIAKVEERRGRCGQHINVAAEQSYIFGYERDRLAATPFSNVRPTEAAKQYAACISSNGNRVVLSGIGGDEVMGGVPTPFPELEDLLARAQFQRLAHQLKFWALNKKRPWIHLLLEAGWRFLPIELVSASKRKQPPPWLLPEFVKRNRRALGGYDPGVTLIGPLPSFQENITTLEVLRRQLSCDVPPSQPPYEKCYPYLDRTLLEFMFAIPREQVVRPGERRFLMRHALTGVVPVEILERKRKAFVVRSATMSIPVQWKSLNEQSQNLISSLAGIVDHSSLSSTLDKLQSGHQIPIVPLLRTLAMEAWLRHQSTTNLAIQMKCTGAQHEGRPLKRFNPFGLNVEQFLGGKHHEV